MALKTPHALIYHLLFLLTPERCERIGTLVILDDGIGSFFGTGLPASFQITCLAHPIL